MHERRVRRRAKTKRECRRKYPCWGAEGGTDVRVWRKVKVGTWKGECRKR